MKKILLTPYHSYVIVTRTVAQFKRAHRRFTKKKDDVPPITHNTNGMAVAFSRKGASDTYLVYAKTTSDLAHEFGHVLLWLFKSIGSDPAGCSGEPFCYLMSHLMDEARK